MGKYNFSFVIFKWTGKLGIDQRKALCSQRILKSDCVRKYAADLNILITSRNDKNIMHSIRITTGPPRE